MEEVEIRTLNDFNDAASEIDYESENIEECLQASGIVKEEIEYDNVTELNNFCSEEDTSESESFSDSESVTKQTSRPKSFSWNTNLTLLLLREYKLRLDKFRNPKYRKADLWTEISNVFHSYGLEIHHALLDKKFRNMKNTFVNIFFSNVDKRNNRPTKWDYYYIFLDLFKDDETFKLPVTYEVIENDNVPVELLSDKDLHLTPRQLVKTVIDQKPISFSWNQEKCMLLLNEYKARLEQFRDSKCQKKTLWTEIKQVFQSLGYNINEEILYRKFRNMKQTYVSGLNSEKRTKWVYYDIFTQLFDNLPTSNVDFSSVEFETEEVTASEINERINSISDKFETNYQNSMLEIQRKRLKLDIEKTAELKKLRTTLEQSNRLQERRNDLLEELIDIFRQKSDEDITI